MYLLYYLDTKMESDSKDSDILSLYLLLHYILPFLCPSNESGQ